MTKDEQARARLVEIALDVAWHWANNDVDPNERDSIRVGAGFKNPSAGSWCAAGLTAAMEYVGLVVPAPGTPARRGAVALLDWVFDGRSSWGARRFTDSVTAMSAVSAAQPGDVIAQRSWCRWIQCDESTE